MPDPKFEAKLHPYKVVYHGAETHSDPAHFTERMRDRIAHANGQRMIALANCEPVTLLRRKRK